MIHSGIVRRSFRRNAKKSCFYRVATESPGQLNAMPQITYQDTLISFVQVAGITEKEKYSAAGAYDEVEKIVAFEAQAVTGRPEVAQGKTGTGDRINIGGVINNGNLEGGIDHDIIDRSLADVNGFMKLRLFVKAVA